MPQTRVNKLFARRAARLAFALVTLVTAARLAHLALPPGNASTAGSAAPGFAGSFHRVTGQPGVTNNATHAELENLYAACPMAAVVDWQTVVTAPEKVDALLPPYRTTADRIVHPPIEPAVPRIRYPIALRRPTTPTNAAGQVDALRVAQAPKSASASDSQNSSGNADDGWFIDPSEWYRASEQRPSQNGQAAETRSAAPQPNTTYRPPTNPPPANTEWKLLTPEDLQQPASAAATATQPAASSPRETPAGTPAIKAAPSAELNTEPLEATDIALPPGEPAAPSEPIFFPPDQSAVSAPRTQPSQPSPGADAPAGDAVVPPAAESPPFAAPPQLPAAEPTPAAEPAPLSESVRPTAPSDGPMGPAESAPAEPAPPAELPSPVNPSSNLFGPPTEEPPSATAQNPPGNCADPHLELLARNAYPSARDCAVCHEDIYHEWSVSAHAYAAVSPMFHKFEQKLNDLTHGTVGYFCMRCHAPVATALCASRDEPIWNLPEVGREGVTCIACHRVQYVYGKSNGERRIEPGDVFAPVFGGIGGEGVAETIHRKEHFKVKTAPHEPGPGQNMHAAGIYFQPLTRSEFCTPCHQVAVHPGIKLEVVWEQYRASPACKKGIQCQDCHMGSVPGLPLGYNVGPVAKIADKTVNDQRKKSNHVFYGPNYSIAHPGLFPFHLKANRWTMPDWLAFDWRAGWGTQEFEDRVADGEIQASFPPVWAEADDRYDAREIIDDNLKKLDYKRDVRVAVMENGSRVEGPFFDSPLCRGQDIHFHVLVTNTNEGHNLLTASLGAQPQLWANAVLIGPDGRRLWETGYTDSCGDLANIHSVDVRRKRLPYDWQLFNLQTMFLITGAKGSDREFPVPVNVDIDQLPFIRPGAQPISTINHPPFIRMESQSLPPLASRRVPYRIPGELIQQPGNYRLSFRMRSRAEPIYFMRFCDATPEMERAMNEWMIDVHPMSVEFVIP